MLETVDKYETVEKMGGFHRNGRMSGSWFGISVYSVPYRSWDAGNVLYRQKDGSFTGADGETDYADPPPGQGCMD